MLKFPNKVRRIKSKVFDYSHTASQFFISDDSVTRQETNEAVNVSDSSQDVMEDDQELKQPPPTTADHQSVEANLDNP